MKLFHLSDLHIGRRIGELSLIEDQRHILGEVLSACDEEMPDGVLIAGDVYDRTLPSVEAVDLLDDFLNDLIDRGLSIFIISGNHDSPQRLGFGNKIFEKSGIHIQGTFDGTLAKKTLQDEFGEVNIYLMPYIKPPMVRPFFEFDIESYEDAVAAVFCTAQIEESSRNIIVAHQFVTHGSAQPEISDSENISVGGLDNIDTSLFSVFDYVALGHLHKPQYIGHEHIRYTGSPLKYSFSESLHKKSLTVVELRAKGNLEIRTIPLKPLRDMREIKGPLKDLLDAGLENPEGRNDLIHATVTDEEELFDVLGQLRNVYPNILRLDFENSRTALPVTNSSAGHDVENRSPLELFTDFYMSCNNVEMTERQILMMKKVFDDTGELLL